MSHSKLRMHITETTTGYNQSLSPGLCFLHCKNLLRRSDLLGQYQTFRVYPNEEQSFRSGSPKKFVDFLQPDPGPREDINLRGIAALFQEVNGYSLHYFTQLNRRPALIFLEEMVSHIGHLANQEREVLLDNAPTQATCKQGTPAGQDLVLDPLWILTCGDLRYPTTKFSRVRASLFCHRDLPVEDIMRLPFQNGITKEIPTYRHPFWPEYLSDC